MCIWKCWKLGSSTLLCYSKHCYTYPTSRSHLLTLFLQRECFLNYLYRISSTRIHVHIYRCRASHKTGPQNHILGSRRPWCHNKQINKQNPSFFSSQNHLIWNFVSYIQSTWNLNWHSRHENCAFGSFQVWRGEKTEITDRTLYYIKISFQNFGLILFPEYIYAQYASLPFCFPQSRHKDFHWGTPRLLCVLHVTNARDLYADTS